MKTGSLLVRCVRHAALLLLVASLTGCLEDGSQSDEDQSIVPSGPSDPGTPSNPPPPVNSPPEIIGTPSSAIEAGQAYSFVPTASDADGDFLEFSISNQPAWAQFSVETGALTGTPTDAHLGESEDITITVTDGRDTRAIGPFRIRVNPRPVAPPPANEPPTISGAAPSAVDVGQTYLFQPSASDPEGATLRFSISNRPSWASFSTSTGRLSGTPGEANIAFYGNIIISVSDGRASASLPPFAIQVRGPENTAPTISGSPGTSVQATQTYSFTPAASDADDDALTFSISNRPAWATFSSSTGQLRGTPSADDVGTYSNVRISVSDGRASTSLPAFSITVQAAPNGTPTINGTPATSATVGTAYSFTPSASDPDGDDLGFTIANRPSWATFDTATGRLSGTPSASHVRTYSNIVISVSDGTASASLDAFSITVSAAENDAPTITGTPATSVNVGSAYNFTPSASDPDGDSLTFSIQNRPSWASFNTSTGRLQGTPTADDAGNYADILISVTDGTNTVSLPEFAINVTQPATGSATVSWVPPAQNEDGSTLTNLAGFRINYGTSASALTQTVELTNAGLTSYVITGLSSGTWYFAVKAYTTSGTESDLSNVASKTIP